MLSKATVNESKKGEKSLLEVNRILNFLMYLQLFAALDKRKKAQTGMTRYLTWASVRDAGHVALKTTRLQLSHNNYCFVHSCSVPRKPNSDFPPRGVTKRALEIAFFSLIHGREKVFRAKFAI